MTTTETTGTLDELPVKVQRLIRNLRKESSLYRIERNEARAEVRRLRAKLGTFTDGE